MTLYTIGFTKKSAEEFFKLLICNSVKRVIDIRLNNRSQLAGFAKGNDLRYFLEKIAGIEYVYMPEFAPTKNLLEQYRQKEVSWAQYEQEYRLILKQRRVMGNIALSLFDNACLLCSESSAKHCHRRLFAEALARDNKEISIVHL